MDIIRSNQKQNRAVELYSHTTELEKDLRSQLKVKNAFEKTVSILRDHIKENYVQIIFLDSDFAMRKDVEQNLWKNVFYKVIEEYRRRIRKCVSHLQRKDRKSRDELHRICESFQNFLQLSTNFYKDLIDRFQKTFHLKLDGSVDYRDEKNQEAHRGYLSCHRCYIFLGDLARYHRDLYGHQAQKDWQKAYGYYRQALRLVPDSGNPHNQLAVLSTYVDDEFNAVYYYFHSLNVLYPFMTGKDNLIVLFEKNKLKLSTTNQMSESLVNQPIEERKKYFLMQFVRLHGILFQKNNIHVLDSLEEVMTQEFKALLDHGQISEELLLKIFVINIFSIYDTFKYEDSFKSSFEDSPTSPFFHHIMSFAFQFLKQVFDFVVNCTDQNINFNKILAPVCVFLDFLQCNPQFLELKKNDRDLWASFASFVNSFHSTMRKEKEIPLPEEIELRGLVPFEKLYRSILPICNSSVSDQEFAQIRIAKIRKFASRLCHENDYTQDSTSNPLISEKLLIFDSEGFHLYSPPSSEETKIYGSTPQSLVDIPKESITHFNDGFEISSINKEDHEMHTSNDLSPEIDEEITRFKPAEGPKMENETTFTQSAIGSGRETKVEAVDHLPSFDLFGKSPVGNNTVLFNGYQGSSLMFSNFLEEPNHKLEENSYQKEFAFASQSPSVPVSSYWSASPNPHSFFSEPSSPNFFGHTNSPTKSPRQDEESPSSKFNQLPNNYNFGTNSLPFPFPGSHQTRYQTKNPFIS